MRKFYNKEINRRWKRYDWTDLNEVFIDL